MKTYRGIQGYKAHRADILDRSLSKSSPANLLTNIAMRKNVRGRTIPRKSEPLEKLL